MLEQLNITPLENLGPGESIGGSPPPPPVMPGGPGYGKFITAAEQSMLLLITTIRAFWSHP
eukprot:5030873-Amphidinium_carterae.1